MRNGHKLASGRFNIAVAITALAACLLTAGGCGGKAADRVTPRPGTAAAMRSPQALLVDGYLALENQQYDEAIAKADDVLAAAPHGEAAAGALYLRGRGFEGQNAAGVSADEAKANLQSARESYIKGLGENPPQPLQSYLRASLGNVAYFQDDYATAVTQLNAAYDGLDRDDL